DRRHDGPARHRRPDRPARTCPPARRDHRRHQRPDLARPGCQRPRRLRPARRRRRGPRLGRDGRLADPPGDPAAAGRAPDPQARLGLVLRHAAAVGVGAARHRPAGRRRPPHGDVHRHHLPGRDQLRLRRRARRRRPHDPGRRPPLGRADRRPPQRDPGRLRQRRARGGRPAGGGDRVL
ncbi:MAG: Isochorismatase, partial [uncultured Thermomicrobiales bacterium]